MADLTFWNYAPSVVAALAVPLLVARSHGALRMRIGGIAFGLFATILGLLLLHWSRLACWSLVTVGVATIGATSDDDRPGRALLLLALPSVVMGLLLQFGSDTAVGLVWYVAGAVPLLLLAGLGIAFVPWLQRDGSQRPMFAAGAVIGAVALIPASSFVPDFLTSFEPAWLPMLLAALAGLLWLATRGARTADEHAGSAWHMMDVGTFLARSPPQSRERIGSLLLIATVVLGLAFLGLARADALSVPTLIAALLPASIAITAFVARQNQEPRNAAILAATLAFGHIVLGVAALDAHIVTEDLLTTSVVGLTALGTLVAGLAFAAGMARAADHRERDWVAWTPESTFATNLELRRIVPRGVPVEPTDLIPDVAALERFAQRLRTEGRDLGIVLVDAPKDNPFWSLPEDVHDWLAEAAPTDPRIHIAIVEGQEVSLVPPLLKEAATG